MRLETTRRAAVAACGVVALALAAVVRVQASEVLQLADCVGYK